MTGAFAKYMIHSLTISFNSVIFYKCLNGSGKTTAVNSVRAFVAKYFIACGIDPNRLITVGNGNTKMVADPGSADAYLNRRTDVFFKIIEE